MAAIGNRINSVLLVLVLLTMLAVLGVLATGVTGGPLDPPGPPGSTDSVRLPGTPISELPYTITESGNYYLTRNLTASSTGNGITISVNHVTLDLMGFTLDGNKVPIGSGSGSGIAQSGLIPLRYVTVKNGTIVRWGNSGVNLPETIFGRYEDLTLPFNGGFGPDGVGLWVGSGSIIERVEADHNAGDGIRVSLVGSGGGATGGAVRDSNSGQNGGDGLQLEDSMMIIDGNTFIKNGQNTGGAGIRISGSDNLIRNNLTDSNGYGIYLEAGDKHNEFARHRAWHNTLEDCHDLGFWDAAATDPYPNEWGTRRSWTVYGIVADYTTTTPWDAMLNFCGTTNPAP
ncbi:MAG: right-handed parallel beta-helix repeat-containing protein [Chloroflexi bacterium]|nr:right-handed parallel beta-helix repeat-containing protein [Chloroflexota bacterium]